MQTKLTFDKSNRVEVEFLAPSMKIKNLSQLDSLVSSLHAPALVIEPSFLPDLNVIRFQRNSQYRVIGCVDKKFSTFGGNKIYEIQNMIEADGFDVGLTNGKNAIELRNEIQGIDKFLKSSGRQFFIRWVIDASQGPKHIEKCISAIRDSKVMYEAIVIKANDMEAKTAHEIVKTCRKNLGLNKAKFKIIAKFSDDLITNDLNITYQISANELI
jgi:hypothetical protein